MPETIKCTNPDCGATIDTKDMAIGGTVTCAKCGRENKVLAEFASAFDISTIKEPEEGQAIAHPARQTCPGCGALLGVRATICPKCGADIRTGAVGVQRVVAKKKNRTPLFVALGIVVLIVVVLVVILILR